VRRATPAFQYAQPGRFRGLLALFPALLARFRVRLALFRASSAASAARRAR
jgi:hypothetical protein